jgi:hypothetical protein
MTAAAPSPQAQAQQGLPAIINDLEGLLCDPEGKACITGSPEDLRLLDVALDQLRALAAQPPLTDAQLWALHSGARVHYPIMFARAVIAADRELRASTAAAPSPVPAGFVLVPQAPSSKMLSAMHSALESMTGQMVHQSMLPVYKAAIAAAPGAPTPAPKGTT